MPLKIIKRLDELFSYRFVSRHEMESFYNAFLKGEAKIDKKLEGVVRSLKQLDDYREEHNRKYIESALEDYQDYLDHILDDVDENIELDDKQRQVVLRDEDYTLVVAGAGAGKTTTVAAKVKYLVDVKKIDPEKILIISYTNDAVNELKRRINHDLQIPAIITTFHKTGYAILKKRRNLEKTRVVHEGLFFNIIKNYLIKQIRQNPEELRRLVLFFGYYIDDNPKDAPFESYALSLKRNDFSSLKENLKEINEELIDKNKKVRKTIRHEIMRSIDEVQIANFLFINNIDYEYETAYPFTMEGSDKLYTPDFTIKVKDETFYLEHFGLHEDGSHTRYTDAEIQQYQEQIKDKILLHKSKRTNLLYTFSQYRDGRSLLLHLSELLEAEGIELQERPLLEIYDQLTKDESNKYITRFIFLIKDFIESFKINGYSEQDFNRLYDKTTNVRNRMFLKLCKPIYLHYQQLLQESEMVDFSDMINESVQIIKNLKMNTVAPDFDYIIVDEYQDISKQRFDLTEALAKMTHAKIMAVGDDWQSIYAFAGSRIDLFLKFKNIIGYADYLNIDYTYRNAQEVIDIAGQFVQKNEAQLTKHLKSPKTIQNPIELYEYSDVVYANEKKGIKGINHEKAKICSEIIGKIINDNPKAEIALLKRYHFEENQLVETEFFEHKMVRGIPVFKSTKFPKAKLVVMTVHASKGLGFDNVIILNGSDHVFGFPSQLEMDPLLKLVKYDDQSYVYAEERRLFYVALTRTKNRVYILYPLSKPSVFVKEIASEYELVVNHGTIQDNFPLHEKHEKNCPVCYYPLQIKTSKAYNGLKLFMCTNDPEVCGYMTNNLKSGIQTISKCPSCKDGFMIVKHSKKTGNHFFGCTNYQDDGKGCNQTEVII
jgi:DNA helicase IV